MLEGRVHWHHIAGAMVGVYDHPDTRPDVSVLWDARDVTHLVIVPDDVPPMKALIERLHPALDGGRSAFLVRREVEGELALFFARLGPKRRREFGVFYRLEQALDFLGRPELPEVTRSDRARVLEVA